MILFEVHLSYLFIIALPMQLWFLFKSKPERNVYLRCAMKTIPIILYAIFVKANELEGNSSPFIFYGLLFSAFADVALEYSGDFIFFVSGILGFILSHIMNFIGFFATGEFIFTTTSISVIMIIAIVWFLFVLRILSFKLDKIMTVACIIYVSFILSGFYSACHVMMFSQFEFQYKILILIGYFCFVCSDFTLFHNVFGTRTELKTFICMLTYYLAQGFLSLGIVLCTYSHLIYPSKVVPMTDDIKVEI